MDEGYRKTSRSWTLRHRKFNFPDVVRARHTANVPGVSGSVTSLTQAFHATGSLLETSAATSHRLQLCRNAPAAPDLTKSPGRVMLGICLLKCTLFSEKCFGAISLLYHIQPCAVFGNQCGWRSFKAGQCGVDTVGEGIPNQWVLGSSHGGSE